MSIIELSPEQSPSDYNKAMMLADHEAEKQLGEFMLLSWYDRERCTGLC